MMATTEKISNSLLSGLIFPKGTGLLTLSGNLAELADSTGYSSLQSSYTMSQEIGDGMGSEDIQLISDDRDINDVKVVFNQNIAPATPVVEQTITRAFYLDSNPVLFSGSTTQTFDTSQLTYTGKAVSMSETDLLAKYTQIYGESQIADNLLSAYRVDSDKDGVIDIYDANPNTWDVSDRDLRMMAGLSYDDEKTIRQLFDDKNQEAIKQYNLKQDGLNGQADVSELIDGGWEVLKVYDSHDLTGSGLDYMIFGHGKTETGYANVVAVFRGSSQFGDFYADAKIMAGLSIGQARDLHYAIADVQSFNPEKLYVTGHSLGGYLAQHFAAYNVANSDLADNFVRSTLFNAAILKTTFLTRDKALLEARKTTDKMVYETVIDNSDLSAGTQVLKKTNSYVIDGEIVSMGLGSYKNSTVIKHNKSHSLSAFYNENSQFEQYFTKGYRMDSWYLNQDTDGDGWTDVIEKHLGTDPNQANHLNGMDTDGDGWSDKLEIQMGTDFYTANSKPNIDSYYDIKADEKAFLAIAGTETESGALVDVQAVEMQAQVQDGKLVYTPTDSKLDLNITSSEWQNWLASGSKVVNGTSHADVLRGSDASEILWGGAGDDTIFVGQGGDVVLGGSGNDTFVFNHLTDKPSIIADFSVGDQLNLNGLRGLFEQDYGANFKWLDVFRETPTSNQSALVWSNETDTLSYQASNGTQLTTIVRFDDDIASEMIRNAMIA